MLVAGHHAARQHVFVVQDFLHIQDRPGGHAHGIAAPAEFVARQPPCGSGQAGHDFIAPRHPHGIARQFRVIGPLRQVQRIAQGFPVLVAAGDLHPAPIATFERGRRHAPRMLGA
ncbi:hypothetical protein G6F68_021081 [Rhizopus microsporus]|nr:hypothetical protein G6F68_021081 [Rhizopus microsporus]